MKVALGAEAFAVALGRDGSCRLLQEDKGAPLTSLVDLGHPGR